MPPTDSPSARGALPTLAVPAGRLSARALTCRRGGLAVLAELDLAVAPGEIVTVAGANGSGKSSLLAVLAGLVPAAAGAVAWNDVVIAQEPEAHHGRLAWLGHGNALKPGHTAERALAELLPPGRADRATRRAGLAALGLGALAALPVSRLSAGQQRRLALARVVASRAPLWLLDEPAAGLDNAARARLGAVLAAHGERGGLAVVATHEAIPGVATRDLQLAEAAA